MLDYSSDLQPIYNEVNLNETMWEINVCLIKTNVRKQFGIKVIS